MSNSLSSAYVDNMSKILMPTLGQALLPLAAFTFDVSSEVKEQGDTVKVALMPDANTVVDLNDATAGDRESKATDITLTSIDVKLDKHPITAWSTTDEEIRLIASGAMNGIHADLIRLEANNIGNNICDQVTSLIINSNFNSPAHNVATVANFDADEVVDIETTLSDANWFTDGQNPTMVLNSAYYGNLKKDRAIQDISASGIPVIRTGIVDSVDRFPLIKYPNLGAQSESLAGFVAKKSAIGIAMRPSVPQGKSRMEAFTLIKEPQSGAVLSVRQWYDPNYGKFYTSVETIFGYAVARSTSLMRLTTA